MDETKDSAPNSPSVSLEALASGDSEHVPDLQVKLETNETSSLPSPSSMRDSDDEAEKEDFDYNNERRSEDRTPIVVPSPSPSSSTAPHVFLADSPPSSSLIIPTTLDSRSISVDASDDVQVVKEVIAIDSGSEDDEVDDVDVDDDDESSSSFASSSQSSHISPRYHSFSTEGGEETDNSDHERWGISHDEDEDDEDDYESSNSSSSSSSAPSVPRSGLNPFTFPENSPFSSVHNLHQMQRDWMMNAHDQIRRASSAAGVLPATYTFTESAFPHTTLHPSSSTSMSSSARHHIYPSPPSSSSSVPIPVSPSSPHSPLSLSPSYSFSPSSPSYFPARDNPTTERRDHRPSDTRPPSSSSSSSSSSPSSSSRIPITIPALPSMGVPMGFPFPSQPATMTTTTTTTRRMSPMDFPHFMPSFGPPPPMMPHPYIDLSIDQPPEYVQLTSTSISSFSPFAHPSFPYLHMPPGAPHLLLHPHSHPHVHTHSRDHSHRRHHHHHHRPHTTVHARPLPHALHQLQFRDIRSEDYEMLRMMEASVSGSSSAGAPQRKIQSLPVSKVTEEESGKHACCVCLDDMLKDDMVKRLPCGHYFHQKCIDEWLQTKQECPLDKKNPFAPVQK
eukprot:TRINITY_DN604_c0_g1_i1.p1 TRINITY_DN604_c0_g1~~TRINITY_DN604_c0_g1_i1.p1  ORF type:complete len:617 (+),score=236.27 TRINITY_DN604_c0_g1_i1:208-2058(+)